MDGARAADQQQVATRIAIGSALGIVADEIEALAAAGDLRPTVIACWQDDAYVGTPPGLLSRLAESCEVVVACTGQPLLPVGAVHVELDGDEELAREWSLTMIAPTGGLRFTAEDLGVALPALRVEDGRAFRWTSAVAADAVVASTQRLVRELGARVPPATAARLHAATTHLAGTMTEAGDADVDDSLHARLTERVEDSDDHRRMHTAAPRPMGGLTALSDWLTDAGPRSPALGMVVVHCDGCAVTASLRDQAHLLGRLGDLVVDVPPDAAMLVMPGLVGDALERRAAAVRETVAAALGRDDVHALGAEVPAVEARLDLVGSLGRALVELRTAAQSV